MNKNSDLNMESSDSWPATLLGALYFLLVGLQLILSDIPLDSAVPAGLRTFDWLLLFGLVIPAIGFAAGWALGFPRWCYPYIGGLLVYSLYMMNMHTPFWYHLGYENQDWGWRAWFPFLLAAATGATISWLSCSRSSPPLPPGGEGSGVRADSPLPPAGEGQAAVSAAGVRAFSTNIYHDPTLATYAMFAWMPLIIFVAFDEISYLYSLVYILLLTALMVATAVLYHRASRGDTRAVLLAAGLLLTLVVSELGMIAYWLPRDGVYLPGALLWGVFIAVVMLYPLWLRHLARPRQKAGAS